MWTQTTQRKTPGIPRSERVSYGLCYICGKPIADIRLSMSDQNTTLCAECYEQRAAHGRWLAEQNKQEFKGRHKTTEMIVRLGLWQNGTKPRG